MVLYFLTNAYSTFHLLVLHHSVSLQCHDECIDSASLSHIYHDPLHADTHRLSSEKSPSKATQTLFSGKENAEDEHDEVQGNEKNLRAVRKGTKSFGIRSCLY